MKFLTSLSVFIFASSLAFSQPNGKIPAINNKADSIADSLKNNQKTIVDSLLQLLSIAKEDTNKFNLLYEVWSEMYSGPHNDTVLFEYASKMRSLAKKIHFVKGVGFSDYVTGIMHYHMEQRDSSLFYFRRSIINSSMANDKLTMISAYGKMGAIFMDTADYPKAIGMILQSLKYSEEIGHNKGIANAYNSLGNVYSVLQNYHQAIIYYKRSLALRLVMREERTISHSYFNLGSSYYEVGKYDSSIFFLNKAYKIQTSMGNTVGQAFSYDVFGNIYIKQGKYDSALVYFQRSMEILKGRNGEETEQAESMLGAGMAYIGKGNFKMAEHFFSGANKISRERNLKGILSNSYNGLSQAMEGQKKYSEALHFHKLYKQLSDSIYSVQNAQQVATLQQLFESDKKEEFMKQTEAQKDAVHVEESKRQQMILWTVLIGLLFVVLFAGFVFRSLYITRKQKKAIEQQKHETEKQKEVIAEKNKDISDSINYAKRIQEAIFPDKGIKYKNFPDAFVLLMPKDVVSGDFPWFTEKNNRRLIAAADCTGHGVPGAFMSMIGNTFLNEIVNERGIVSPDEILGELRFRIIKALKQTGADGEQKDGMDIALLSFDDANSTVEYSGAYNSLWFFRNGEFTEYDANKRPIGYYQGRGLPFKKHLINVQKGDALYIFTDGFADQFGGPKGKKFRYKQLQEKLMEICQKPMLEQEGILLKVFSDWKGDLEQVDDVLVIGIKI